MSKTQKVLINSIWKIKMSPWCDIVIVANNLIPIVSYQRLDLLEEYSEGSLQNRLQMGPSRDHSAVIILFEALQDVYGFSE